MGNSRLYIHKMAGIFPGASSVEDFWLNLLHAKVAKKSQLDSYWKIKKETYSDRNNDQYISMDFGYLTDIQNDSKSYPRQIQGAIEVGSKLLESYPRHKRNIGLIIATEWTDPSFYKSHIGETSKEHSFDVERQLNAIKFGLRISGPSLAIDTACASSLYALDLARGFLESSSLDGVVILGLNLYLHSFLYRGFTKLGALSQTGSLRSFDKNADGIVPGEAVCGILVNLESSHSIAEIAGIGLSSDGNEGSPFSPGFNGQLSAYKRAYLDANLSPQEIDYIEAHGTATTLGDDTECRSLGEFFKPSDSKKLIVGSSKANIGHTLAASGLVSIIKSALIIKHKKIPAHININPIPRMQKNGIETLKEPLKLDKKIIKIGISSFGFGGSNAHVILKTPEEKNTNPNLIEKTFFINKFEFMRGLQVKPPIIEGVPMGPKMQERIDPLQRWALKLTQDVLKSIQKNEQEKLSCLFLNNLGGNLSIDFEKKYVKGLKVPELSIEAIASTLPSMLSGFPSLLFNFRGTHMLVSGGINSVGDLLLICPYLLTKFEGDLILGFAHQDYDKDMGRNILGVFHVSKTNRERSLAMVTISQSESESSSIQIRDAGECTGLNEIIDRLTTPSTKTPIYLGNYTLDLSPLSTPKDIDENLRDSIIQKSQENKEIALEYVELLKALVPQKTKAAQVGLFLKDCLKFKNTAEALLVVDENHSYFFDHPLDHVPGILTIHGAEELIHWYLGENYFINKLNVKFTKFLEKNKKITIQLTENNSDNFECRVYQEGLKAGVFQISTKKHDNKNYILPEKVEFDLEDKKYLHKFREENVLVSRLKDNSDEAWALDLNTERGEFFLTLERPSTLYYAEISRQFVMLLAHHRKEIPLSTKMNLIMTEILIDHYFSPPFKLKLKDFLLTDTKDFLVADIFIEFTKNEMSFGTGRVKAQVVSNEYYEAQRKNT